MNEQHGEISQEHDWDQELKELLGHKDELLAAPNLKEIFRLAATAVRNPGDIRAKEREFCARLKEQLSQADIDNEAPRSKLRGIR